MVSRAWLRLRPNALAVNLSSLTGLPPPFAVSVLWLQYTIKLAQSKPRLFLRFSACAESSGFLFCGFGAGAEGFLEYARAGFANRKPGTPARGGGFLPPRLLARKKRRGALWPNTALQGTAPFWFSMRRFHARLGVWLAARVLAFLAAGFGGFFRYGHGARGRFLAAVRGGARGLKRVGARRLRQRHRPGGSARGGHGAVRGVCGAHHAVPPPCWP